MVTPDDDWKNVTVPEGEAVAATPAAESKPATTTAAAASSTPEATRPTQTSSSSHVIDIHSLENL